ncbi:hypothetical protein FGO68_gene2298 [Halteria grandinella]|uniref:Uncharacterized protein n=1 Tax=Halteria grandinella TaxID=5974 RepID=A0A8J8P300_HALGN|nr:hypothetical protein FGO68_gene2298 [Halteria grandinella]
MSSALQGNKSGGSFLGGSIEIDSQHEQGRNHEFNQTIRDSPVSDSKLQRTRSISKQKIKQKQSKKSLTRKGGATSRAAEKEREKIQALLRSNYYYNNFSMQQSGYEQLSLKLQEAQQNGSRDLRRTVKTFNSNTRSGAIRSNSNTSGGANEENRVADLKMRMEVMKMQMRFPLSDIQKEGEQYYQEVRQRFGQQQSYEKMISMQINMSKHNIFE